MSQRTYCDLDEVKRLLRSVLNRESRIRFSSAYRDLKADRSNLGDIILSGVSFNDSFSAHETFAFLFSTGEDFSVSGDVLGFLGQGDVNSDFEVSEMFIVPSESWVGTAQAGDKVYITSNSDISDEDGEEFVLDATRFINAKLEAVFGSLSFFPFVDDETISIPQGIHFACSRYAAYFIFNSVFASFSDRDQISPSERWRAEAEEALLSFLLNKGSAPAWKSREALVSVLGIKGVGAGEIDIANLPDSITKAYSR